MADKPNLDELFLKHVQSSHAPVTVFLTNGVKLSGTITWFDETSLSLSRDGVTQLVFKHAISTVMPQEEFQIFDLQGLE